VSLVHAVEVPRLPVSRLEAVIGGRRFAELVGVPGPQQPLYGLGRRLVEIIPYVPIATTLRTGIAIFTYCGTVTFGITGDFAANPDLGVLARGIEHDLSELLAAAQRHQRASVTS
jgi:WS/DGAT C-terminal domain